MAAHPPDALPTNAGADLSGNGKKRKSDLLDQQPTISPNVRNFSPSLLSSAEKKLLQSKAAISASAHKQQHTMVATPNAAAGISPKRVTSSKSPPSLSKSRASSERRKRIKGAKVSNESHKIA